MITLVCLVGYVTAVVIALNKRGNWYKHLLVLQAVVSVALITLFLLRQYSDVVLLLAGFVGLILSFIAFIPRIRNQLGF